MASIAPEGEASPRFLVIGEVLRPQGVRGEVRVRILTDFPERFHLLERAYLGQALTPITVEGARLHGRWALLKFAGYDDRTSVEGFRGALIQIPVEEAGPLEEGEYFVHQIVGLAVWTDEGEYLGRVREILSTGANDVYIVWGPRGEMLLPAIEEVIGEVDLEGGRLTVTLLQGLV